MITFVRKNVIAVIGYSRPNLLENCIVSVINSESHERYFKILICQRGHEEVHSVSEKYRQTFDLIVEVERTSNYISAISKNRYLAYQLAFDHFQADFVVVLEDDVEISTDALVFSENIYSTFKKSRTFRAINLSSGVPFDPKHTRTFSKVRYALNGPASILPRRSWNSLKKRNLMQKSEYEIFDGTFETYIQTGFVVMPNSARYLDHGRNGTHSNEYSDKSYFDKLESSFNFDLIQQKEPYLENYVNQNWREDCVRYSSSKNGYFLLRDLLVSNRDIKFVKMLLNFLRIMKKRIRFQFFPD